MPTNAASPKPPFVPNHEMVRVIGRGSYGEIWLARSLTGAWHAGRVPVLAPYQWLRHADPVPHSWDATSDSIAAWIAVTLRATHLVLIKPAAGAPRDMAGKT